LVPNYARRGYLVQIRPALLRCWHDNVIAVGRRSANHTETSDVLPAMILVVNSVH